MNHLIRRLRTTNLGQQTHPQSLQLNLPLRLPICHHFSRPLKICRPWQSDFTQLLRIPSRQRQSWATLPCSSSSSVTSQTLPGISNTCCLYTLATPGACKKRES